MNSTESNYCLNHLDRVYSLLDPTEAQLDRFIVVRVVNKILLLVKRIIYYLLDYGRWYNSDLARKLVQHYIYEATAQPAVEPKLLKICQHLLKEPCTKTQSYEIRQAIKVLRPRKKTSPRVLLHIAGDEFGRGSQLEGAKSSEMLEFLWKFLKDGKGYGVDTALLKELEEATIFALSIDEMSFSAETPPIELIEKCREQIQKRLTQKKPFLLPGGWVGAPGHAMYYELFPQKEGKVSLRIFNLGGGSENHPKAVVDGKEKTSYTEWSDIPTDKVLSHEFLQALYELRHSPQHDQKRSDYSPVDIYKSLHGLLGQPKQTVVVPEYLMSGQRSGTCTWRSLCAFLASRMTRANYKRFKHDVQMMALTERVENATAVARDEWNLIHKSHQSLGRKVRKAFKNAIIGKETVFQDHRKLKEVRKFLQSHRPSRAKGNPATKAQFKKPSDGTAPLPKEALVTAPPLDKGLKQVPFHPPSEEDESLYYGLAEGVQKCPTLEEKLSLAERCCEKALRQKNHQALDLGMVQMMERLPNQADDFLNLVEGNPDLARECILSLGRLSKMYFENCFLVDKSENVDPERYFVLNRITQMQVLLAGVVDRQWEGVYLSHYFSIPFFHFEKLEHNRNICQREEWISLFIHSYYNSPPETSMQHSYSNYDGDDEIYGKKLIQLLEASSPQLRDQLTREDPSFPLRPAVQQMTRIFSSKHLPDWIQAIRSTLLSSHYILKETVAKPLTPKGPLEVHISPPEDKENSSTLYYSVPGMDGKLLEVYPKVKHDRNNPELRYSHQFRAFSNPDWYQDALKILSGKDEKLLYQKHPSKNSSLTQEEFQELLQIRSQSDLSAQKLLGYLVKYPEKINDLDFQVLFKALFLSITSNSDFNYEKEYTTSLESGLSSFLEKSYQTFLSQNEVQTSVFLLQIAHLLSFHFPDTTFFQQSRAHLYDLLSRTSLDIEERSAIHAELLAQLKDKETLDPRDVQELLVGSTFLSDHPVPDKWSDPMTTKKAKDALLIHRRALKEAFSDVERRDALFNKVLKEVESHAGPQTWHADTESTAACYRSEDGQLVYYPLSGSLHRSHQTGGISYEVRSHPFFQKLFPDVVQAETYQGGVLKFRDQNGMETLVQLKNNELKIEQNRGGRWMRFLPSHHLYEKVEKRVVSALGSRELVHSYTHWQDIQHPDKIDIVDPQSQKSLYTATIHKNQLKEIRRIRDGARLGTPSEIARSFEDPTYIHEWYDSNGKLVELELPRFNLSFVMDPKLKVLKCLEIEGYVLDPEATVPSLGAFKRFLSLKNAAGKELVLIPDQKFTPPQEQEVLLPRFSVRRETGLQDREKQKYFSYEVDPKGQLAPSSRASGFYLALVLGLSQEYAAAAKTLVDEASKLTPLKKKEQKILQVLLCSHLITGDACGNAYALRNYVGCRLLRHALSHREVVDSDTLNLIYENYRGYLDHLHHVTALPLDKEDEILLLKFLLSKTFDSLLFTRLKTLDPEAAEGIRIVDDEILPSNEFTPSFKNLNLSERSSSPPPFDKIPVTRPGKILSNYLLHFYEIARAGSAQDKEKLYKRLIFLRNDPDKAYQLLGEFLETVLQHPREFIAAPAQDKNEDFRKWKKKTVKTANRLRKRAETSPDTQAPPPLPIHESPVQPNNPSVQRRPMTLSFQESSTALNELTEHFSTSSKKHPDQKSAQEMRLWIEAKIEALPVTVDPIEKGEWERLREDLYVFEEKAATAYFQLADGSSLESLGMTLEKRVSGLKTELKEKELALESLANKPPKDPLDKSLRDLEHWGKTRSPLTLEKLILYFGQRSVTALLRDNPALCEKEATLLMDTVGEYLIEATAAQQIVRAQSILHKIKKLPTGDHQGRQILTQKLGQTLIGTKRAYDPTVQPEYLVFEYASDLLIYENQVQQIHDFLTNSHINPVVEMIMGSGKSSVLLPLLGLLRADGKNISMIVIPEPLLEDLSEKTQKILMKSVEQRMKILPFERNTDLSPLHLDLILDDLKSVRDNRECLIMTGKSLECLLLKFIEEYDKFLQSKETELPETLVKMREILILLQSAGYPIIDEADTILNILHETCFSMGETLSPQKEDLALISEIYALLLEDPDIKELAQLESDPSPDERAPQLTENVFKNKVRACLAKKLLANLKTAAIGEKAKAFFQELNPEDQQIVLDYLCRNEERLPAAQAFYNQLDKEIQDRLALAGEELCHLLSHTLLKISDEGYGIDEEYHRIHASPFAAAQTPSHGSEFANPYVTMNATYQIYSKKGISRTLIEKEIERLQASAIKDLQSMPLEESNAWKKFCILRGDSRIPLFNYKESELDLLVKSINSTPENKRRFVEKILLPQMQLHKEKLSCNSLNMIAFLRRAMAFTGTLWNGKSMHRSLTPQPAKGTDGKTLALLYGMKEGAVIPVTAKTGRELSSELRSKNIDFDLFADAGGYCKERSDVEIARDLAAADKPAVACYDKSGVQVIVKGDKIADFSRTSLQPNERRTFLSQRFTTGAHVTQKQDAIGLVTIGKNMILRDLLQSVWRLRALDAGQKVHFLINEEVMDVMRQELKLSTTSPITYQTIVDFMVHNQSKRVGDDNLKALKKELRSIPQMILFSVMMNPKVPIERLRELHDHLRSTWVQQATRRPRELFGKVPIERDGDLVVEEEKKLFEESLETLSTQYPWLEEFGIDILSLKEEGESIIQRMENSLHHKVVSPLSDDDNTMEMETQREEEVEEEVEIQVEEIVSDEKDDITLINCEARDHVKVDSLQDEHLKELKEKLPVFTLESYLRNDPELREFASAFSEIEMSINALQFTETTRSVKELRLFGFRQTPVNFVRIESRTQRTYPFSIKTTVHLLTQQDMRYLKYFNYHLENGFQRDSDRVELTPELKLNIAKVKFLYGNSHFTKDEIDILRPWLRSEGPKKMERFFRTHAVSGFPQRALAYNTSSLKQLFTELKTTAAA